MSDYKYYKELLQLASDLGPDAGSHLYAELERIETRLGIRKPKVINLDKWLEEYERRNLQ